MFYSKILRNFINNNLLIHLDRLLKRPNIENGLIQTSNKQIKKLGNYVYGGFTMAGSRPIKDDGNFEDFMSTGEQQNHVMDSGEDAMWCVNENGICNAVETLFNYLISLKNPDTETAELLKIFEKFGLIVEGKCLLDTAYNAVGSGTSRRGNSYENAGDFARHYGFIPKGMFPNYGKWKNWNDLYYSGDTWINGNKINKDLLDRGKALIDYIDITYEWYRPNSKEANINGVPGTSVGAWSYPENGIYHPMGISINHAIYRPKTVDSVKTIGDSYNPFKKLLSLDYTTGNDFVLHFRVKKPLTPYNQEEINKLKARGLDYVLLVNQCGEYAPGAYKLTDKIEKADLKVVLDNGIQKLAQEKKLVGINADDFKKLVNIF